MFIFIGVGVYNPIPVYKWFLEPEARTALDAAVASGELADTKLKAAKMGVGNANLPGQAAAYFKQKGQDSFAVDVNAAAADTRTFWIVVLLGLRLCGLSFARLAAPSAAGLPQFL